jgi:hypothetical protein
MQVNGASSMYVPENKGGRPRMLRADSPYTVLGYFETVRMLGMGGSELGTRKACRRSP